MKIKYFIYISSLFIFLGLISCNSKESQFIKTNEISVSNINDKEWDFTMYHSPKLANNPVVHLQIGNSTYYFLVDTGATHNFFYGLPDSCMEKIDGGSIDAYAINMKTEENNFRIFFTNKFFSEIKNMYDGAIDGIIGCEFLQQYNNVVFDFKRNKIIFDSKPIKGNETPLLSITPLSHCIEFFVNDKIEYGLIDTGSSLFILRENFGDGNAEFNRKELQKVKFKTYETQNKFKTKNNGIKIITDIKAINLECKEIPAVDWDSKLYVGVYGIQFLLRKVNCLGNCFWNGHIVQLDFYNGVLRLD